MAVLKGSGGDEALRSTGWYGLTIAARFLVLLLVCCALPCQGAGSDTTSRENPIKAAFLFNFARFIDWPQHAFSASENLVIAVAGSPAMLSILTDIAKEERVSDRKVSVMTVQSMATPPKCHILYVSASLDGASATTLLSRVRQPGVLTVGDSANFISTGGIIRFYLVDRKIHFEIGVDRAARAGLRIGSQLLRLGRIIR
jgi:hypothetical protein